MNATKIGLSLLCLIIFILLPNISLAQEGVEETKGAESDSNAEDEADEAEFNRLMNAAAQARKEKRYEDVVTLILKAYNKFPDPGLLFNLAIAYEDQEDCKNALQYFMAAAKGGNKEIVDRVDKELMEFQCGEGTQAFLEDNIKEHNSAALHVRLADLFVQKRECAHAQRHLLKAVEIGEEGNAVSKEAMEKLGKFDCPSPEEKVIAEIPQDKEEDGFDTLDYVSFASMGTGGLMLVAGLISDLSTLNKIDEYRAVADSPDVSLQKRFDLKEEVETGQTTSLILYAAGGVLAAGGLTLFLINNQMETETMPESSRSSPLTLAPIISDRLLGASLRMDF